MRAALFLKVSIGCSTLLSRFLVHSTAPAMGGLPTASSGHAWKRRERMSMTNIITLFSIQITDAISISEQDIVFN